MTYSDLCQWTILKRNDPEDGILVFIALATNKGSDEPAHFANAHSQEPLLLACTKYTDGDEVSLHSVQYEYAIKAHLGIGYYNRHYKPNVI